MERDKQQNKEIIQTQKEGAVLETIRYRFGQTDSWDVDRVVLGGCQRIEQKIKKREKYSWTTLW